MRRLWAVFSQEFAWARSLPAEGAHAKGPAAGGAPFATGPAKGRHEAVDDDGVEHFHAAAGRGPSAGSCS